MLKPEAAGIRNRSSRARSIVRLVRRQPVGVASAIILAIVFVLVVLAPFVAPYDPVESIAGARLKSPSLQHVFGTDNASRDIFSRVVWGGRNSLFIGTGAVIVGLTGATTIGLVSGYLGGWVDQVLQRVVDAMMSIPGLLLIMVMVTILGTGRLQVLFAIAVGLTFPNSRTVRSAAIGVRGTQYVAAAQAMGASPLRIMVRHVLPNMMAPLTIIATVSIGAAITLEASLSFLGLGVPPPEPTWGQMLGGRTRAFMLTAPWMALAPGLALTAVVFSFNMLGDMLRDVLDPRLRI